MDALLHPKPLSPSRPFKLRASSELRIDIPAATLRSLPKTPTLLLPSILKPVGLRVDRQGI